jgi:hypothetical protein
MYTTYILYVIYIACAKKDRIAKEVVDAAVKLHRHFGPGVDETVYERAP